MRRSEAFNGAAADASPQGFAVKPPSVSLPKGGGAIHGIGEKFAANPVTGTGGMSVPIATSPGRGGFGPQLALSYDSGAGNGPFGLGWSLGLAGISRKTDKGLPRYDDAAESDTFILAGAEDLVPRLDAGGQRPPDDAVRVYGRDYLIRQYLPRSEGAFARIERWSDADDPGHVFWRTISRDNVTAWYGRSAESRVFDPDAPERIFQWWLCETYDDRGNAAVYRYQPEDGAGVDRAQPFEANRPRRSRGAVTHIAGILYGNREPFLPTLAMEGTRWQAAPDNPDAWMFEVRFDYGDFPVPKASESDPEEPDALQPELGDRGTWTVRSDPFSTHRAGFELRNWRLCRRILMLHHFPEAADTGAHCLVRSTDLGYAEPAQGGGALAGLLDPEVAGYATLVTVTQRSYERQPAPSAPPAPRAGYHWRALPSVTFSYSAPRVGTEIRRIAAADLPNLPVGTQGPGCRWVDLDGEGLSGVLCDAGGVWHYAPNRGGGRFGRPRVVAPVPAMAAVEGGQQLIDLTGDGRIDVVTFDGATPGFHERAGDGGWTRHVAFAALPNLDWQDPNLRFVDLTGDGQADVLITEDDVLTWYPSLEARGFGPALRQRLAADEDRGPRLAFSDASQTIFLADMCGDGLADLVRIRNGALCYWPNLGHGRFGAKVTMANAPRFDTDDLFDPSRIRLADIDGSGPTDVLYLGRKGAQLYVNRSGNSLSAAWVVPLPVAAGNLAFVQVADLLGTGTACLVWNSALPGDAGHPVRYVELMAAGKPHLLTRSSNGLGGMTEISYTPSTRFYLDDLAAGRPWRTRLPFPVHCVSKVTLRDAWRDTAFSSTYSYHHGCFDGTEREFRGFGRVEQIDLDAYGADENAASPSVTGERRLLQAPVKTVTWYHTGLAARFSDEFFPARLADRLPRDSGAFREKPPAPPALPPELTPEERPEALRACRGMMLRQEVYELDLEAFLGPAHQQRDLRLYSVETRGYAVRRLQPRGPNRHAVMAVNAVEAVTYHHELALPGGAAVLAPDPRIAQTINLRHDALGNVEQAVTIGYPRWRQGSYPGLPDPDRIAALQAEMLASYVETRHTDDVLLPARPGDPLSPLRHHRRRLPCETRGYALSGLQRPAGGYLGVEDLRQLRLSEDQTRFPAAGPLAGQRAVGNLRYHEQPPDLTPHRRIVERRRMLYLDDARDTAAPSAPLPFGQIGPRALPYESYGLALTEALLTAVFGDKLDWLADPGQQGAPGRSCRDILRDPGLSGYVAGSAPGLGGTAAELWIRSGRAGFAPDAHRHFFLAERFTDAFGHDTTVSHDALDLYLADSTDARGNRTRVRRFDYRLLAPVALEDANGTRTEIAHDILGRVIAMAVMGKDLPGAPRLDSLAGYDLAARNPAAAAVAAFCQGQAFGPDEEARARQWLGEATARFVYHFGGPYAGDGRPLPGAGMACACAIRRETHAGLVAGGAEARLQIALECSDGSGSVLMQKVQAEPDPATPAARRWLINGFTLVNNKGKPVRQFQPAFSPRFGCERPADSAPSATILYDAIGRAVRQDMPDGTFSRVEFAPWDRAAWDANDTVLDSAWYRQNGRNRLDPGQALPHEPTTLQPAYTAEERAGWLAARHAGTPTRSLLDSLGREVITLAHNRERATSGALTFDGAAWRDVLSATVTRLDAEGKPLWVRDALGHLVMQYIIPPRATDAPGEGMPAGATPCYDMAGNLLFQHSMDAGSRWVLNDAAGRPLFGWDVYRAEDLPSAPPQKRLYRTEHDALHRPLRRWLTLDDAAPRLIEGFDYCDTVAPRDAAGGLSLEAAQRRNLMGVAVAHRDPSGLATVERVDTVSGQPVHVTRRLIAPAAGAAQGPPDLAVTNGGVIDWGVIDWGVVDWGAGDAALLEPAAETFHQITERDALGRMTRLYNWHRDITFGAPGGPVPSPGQTDRVAVYEPGYNARGLLEAERLYLRARKTSLGGIIGFLPDAARKVQAIVAISYDERGQRLSLRRGNGTTTTYSHDPQSFRLTALETLRQGDGKAMQRLAYVYDPVGNITHLRDEAQETVYHRNRQIRPEQEYTHDALYRLTEATGRESAAAPAPPPRREGGWPQGAFPNGEAPRSYRQRYVYDAVGNFERMVHVADGGGWTRHYALRPGCNRLARTWIADRLTEAVDHVHDSHGNMLTLNRRQPPAPVDPDEDWGRQIGWDWRDVIHRFDAIGGGIARYHHGIDKARSRKHITRLGGGTEDRIYLDGYELYRRRSPAGAVVEEIESHHLLADDDRVLMVDDVLEARDQPGPNGRSPRAQTLLRYQYGNHLGSVALELDGVGQVISYEEYHPYGSAAFRQMNAAIEAPAKRYRYTGMERDEESGLSYHGARYLAAWLGRWVSCDPAGIDGGLNLYGYADSNPVVFIDIDGLAPFKPNSRNTRVDVRNSTNATNAVMKARGQDRLEEQLRLDAKSRTDGLAVNERGELFIPEDKTMRVNRYPESEPAKLTNRFKAVFDQAERYQNTSGLPAHVYVWLKNEKSPNRSQQIADVAKTIGKNRGIAVTVGSLQRFLSTGNALKSTFSFAVGVFAFLKGGEAEAKPSQTRSDLSDALPSRAEIVDAVTPDEVMLLVDAAAAFLAVDDFSPKTANKALVVAKLKNSNLTQIDGLPLVLDVSTGDLFGMNMSVLNTSANVPGALTPLGRLNGSQVFGFFVSADDYVGFVRTADNHWQMKVRVPGEGWKSLK